MGVARRVSAPVAALAAAFAVGACGADDFPNEPRPPAPIDLTARVDDRAITISPDDVGAGVVTIVTSNQSRDPATITLDGPTTETGREIPPAGVAEFKVALEEGRYEVSAGPRSDARPDRLVVGPERESSQNELLLP